MKLVWLFGTATTLAATWACSGNDGNGASGGGAGCELDEDCPAGERCNAAGECVPESSTNPGECSETIAVPWLNEGNFWQVSWFEIDYEIGLFESDGRTDVGSYTMKLGEPATLGGFTMYPLELTGDSQKYPPLWSFIGTDECGNILGSTGSDPVVIYSLAGNEWTGRGFWTRFEGVTGIGVNRSASIIPSQYTVRLDYFEPPLTSVGRSTSDSGSSGTGCEYFAGYGTICGSDSSGSRTETLVYEYWAEEAGPVAMHYSYDYDSGGSLSSERHTEQRVEVWFFGDTSDGRSSFETEPDSYVDPTPLPIQSGVYTVFAEVNEFDVPGGLIPGVSPVVNDQIYAEIQDWYPFDRQEGERVAARIHDWYEFEIVNPDERVEFYVTWDAVDQNLDLHWFAAPDHPEYGFLYLGEDYIDPGAFPEFAHVKGIPNPTVPGKYLLGVERTTDSRFATQYGVLVLK